MSANFRKEASVAGFRSGEQICKGMGRGQQTVQGPVGKIKS